MSWALPHLADLPVRPVRFSSPGADGQAASGLHPAMSPSPPPLLALTGSTVSPQLSQASCRTPALGQVLLPASTWDLGVLCLACNCCVLCKWQSLKKCGSPPSLPAFSWTVYLQSSLSGYPRIHLSRHLVGTFHVSRCGLSLGTKTNRQSQSSRMGSETE